MTSPLTADNLFCGIEGVVSIALLRQRVETYGGMQLTKCESIALFDRIANLERENAELKHECENWKQLHDNDEACIANMRAGQPPSVIHPLREISVTNCAPWHMVSIRCESKAEADALVVALRAPAEQAQRVRDPCICKSTITLMARPDCPIHGMDDARTGGSRGV